MKSAIIVLGLWLAGAPNVVASACCAPEASRPASCGGCGETESKQACCVTNVAPADAVADIPSGADAVSPLVEDAPIFPLAVIAVSRPTTSGATSLHVPLYLRHRTLLI